MNRLAVSGYASLDYPIGLMGRIHGNQTTWIRHRDPQAWPRLGGCPTYVATAAAARGQAASPVTWVGSDAAGDVFQQGLAARGVDVRAVARMDGHRSPVAILAYQEDGACACLFDPALSGQEQLNSEQRNVLSSASHVCITVGPPHLTLDILACRAEGARVYWVLKNDAHCFTPELCREIAGEAHVILGNRAERSLIGEVRPEVTVVETDGGRTRVWRGGLAGEIAIDLLPVVDATGAGDSFAGGFIAAEMNGVTDPVEAADVGAKCARRMLEERMGAVT